MRKIIIISILFGALLSSKIQNTYAIVLSPYIVDEKPQVLFGDSVGVSTYLGLENYTSRFIDGYLHISFTYTHARCCFASFPPNLYITSNDPRATSTPVIRSLNPLSPLFPVPIPPGHETDWYSYDIQFNETGYTTIVKQAGNIEVANIFTDVPKLAEEDWVSLANHYPLTDPPTQFSMSFTPTKITHSEFPPEQEIIDPVIIVPGIMGSAYKNGKLIIDPILHTYDDLTATLIANGYIEGNDLFTFPYEWRDSNVFSANLLSKKIKEVKSICACNKVDLVTHSMGGLVARSYIESVDYNDDIDQLIFLGVPHNGTPTSYLRWEAGKFSTGRVNVLAELFFEVEALRNGYSTIFNYIHNRPVISVQELLPTLDYLKDANTGLIYNYPNNYPRNIYLENLNNNVSKLLNSGVDIVNIIGYSGSNTIEHIRVVPSTQSGMWEHGEPEGFAVVIGDNGLERGAGDNTVTTLGSTLNGLINEEISASHNRIPTLGANRIVKILTGKDSVSNIDNGSDVDAKILLLQLLSPIDVLVTAPDGKKIGKNFSNSTEYNEIPLAFYSGYKTDNEYITILNPLDGSYRVEVQGTGDGGEYSVLTNYISDATSTTRQVYGLTEPNQITRIDLEVSNNNSELIEPQRIITSRVLLNDILKAYKLGWITNDKFKDKLTKQVENIIKIEKSIEIVLEKFPDGKKKERRVERLEERVDKKAIRTLLIELKGYKKDKLNTQAYNLIKEDLEWLIKN